ncbi:cell envelope integrity protein TolA [Sodalis endosymbiont of Henestaris halophilus]|uniref:cell envelope integrity protein TolA n=1 Tax=Sodalis endosymbiont of Henestaris halophilus TaxID=1929246 RepID=UPI000BC04D58|nr:cell envelope integrity protein TolA [Sodalis endosymbiont of Henestaris halophilus]SNC59103.1 cell envelope integrity inner membrane protein TolA [Sodalis endosymbiont of Henestaris halophilus]
MLKDTKHNGILKRAIILSITMHCILLAVFIWNSIHQSQETNLNGVKSPIHAVMVDPRSITQKYNLRQPQQIEIDEQQAQHQVASKLQHLKKLEKQRLAVQEAANAKQRQYSAAQKKTAAKAYQASKDKVVTAKKTTVKHFSDVDALLGDLTDSKPVPKTGFLLSGDSKAKQSGVSGSEIDAYKAEINRAISNKFYDASSYIGKTCDLYIKLAPDGLLLSVTAVGGDLSLCKAATSAAKLATIPRPPTPQVYETFKNVTLRFSPQ